MIQRRGVSLLEILVCVAVVAVLTAIGIAALRRSVLHTRDAQDLSRLSQSMQHFAQYANDHADLMVNAGLPDDPRADWFYRDRTGEVRRSMYLSQAVAWPRILHHWSGEDSPAWHSVDGRRPIETNPNGDPLGLGRDYAIPTLFSYSYAMLTDPQLWTFPGRGFGVAGSFPWYREVRASQIVSPSAKGVLLFDHRESSGHWLAALADGSAAARRPSDAVPAAAPPWGNPQVRGRAVINTMDGHRGVDF